jgi:hypothetical protein
MRRHDVEHLLAIVDAAARLDRVAEDDLLAVSWSIGTKRKRPPRSMVQPVKARATSITSFCV